MVVRFTREAGSPERGSQSGELGRGWKGGERRIGKESEAGEGKLRMALDLKAGVEGGGAVVG